MAQQIEYLEERYFLPDRETLKSIFKKDELFRYFVYAICGIGLICSIVCLVGKGGQATDFIARSFLALSALFCFGLYVSRDKQSKKKENENITPNEPTAKPYMLNIGFEAKKLFGSAVKTVKAPNNLIRPLLLDTEQFKRHMLIMATIGAGKSVFMKGMIEQQLLLGGGGLCVDGKGTAEFAKEIYGLCVALGREDDFIHINFLDMDNTHTVNPLLSGSAEALYEILIALLAGEENEWKAKQKEFMKNILKLLVWRRDNENLALDFAVLSEYMTLQKIVKDALKYRDFAYSSTAIQDYIMFASSSIGIDYQDFLIKKDKMFEDKCMEQSGNTDLQGVYDASMSAQAWRGIITNLKSDYGKVFNTQTPTISMWEAVQRNKFIFVTLPTMASDTTPKDLGRLILGLIKGVAAEKAEKAVEPKIPFVCWFDEAGSYIIEGFGRLMSKSRSLGISVIPIFQSVSQINAVGKLVGSESTELTEIKDVTGTHILMKNINPEATEFYSKLVEEKKFIDMEYSDRRTGIKGSIGAEDRYKVEKEQAIKHKEVIAMNNGEMIVFNDGKVYRASSVTENSLKFGKKITYEAKEMSKPIPITEHIPKKEFLAQMYRLYSRLDEKR
ncbi:TraM recognition domain-containing protein [Campylobacter sp. faydin G-140]|uniref:type IV secretory system conjugative DNA transfer family protein n=1 Tax=Campylobacter anatolicus TaxID=2829105 RepID=UPI001BA2599C|nr:TraM recognition domain-containing protein [Campylobacter anatolicus]MBR8466506.1 TraM recognition domain-containing protein [Campylobacter anatolicus]